MRSGFGRGPAYRSDIDGLRAVAVVLVVAFHAFPDGVPGGFIGVDVFFVISGYLISGILLRELQDFTFSAARFYGRRIRRIFPALALVLAGCLAGGWFDLLPGEYAQVGRHVGGGAGFVSNFLLWSENGYFDKAAETKPLLHLWSLGVEEQFYIVWPLVMWLVRRWRSGALAAIASIGMLSFAVGAVLSGSDPTAAFYAPYSRFWELMGGAALADLTHRGLWPAEATGAAWWRDGLSVIGLALVIASAFGIKQDSRLLGFWAVLPVVGAIGLIAAGGQAWVNRVVLSHRLAVAVGLISYPLYLWHWPLLSFARIVNGEVPSALLRVEAVAASVVLAWSTYRFVERPIRFGPWRRGWVVVLVLLVASLGGGGLAVSARNGLPWRFPEAINRLAAFHYDFNIPYRYGTCFLAPNTHTPEVLDQCIRFADPTKPVLVLWGDSHAAHLYPGYAKRYPQYNIAQMTVGSCGPIVRNSLFHRAYCEVFFQHEWELVRQAKPARIILAARWKQYEWANLAPALEDTVAMIRQQGYGDIVLVGPVPEWKDSLGRQMVRQYLLHVPHAVPSRLRSGLVDGIADLDRNMRILAEQLHIRYVSPYSALCNADGCLALAGVSQTDLVTWDYGHLTAAGSTYVVSQFPED